MTLPVAPLLAALPYVDGPDGPAPAPTVANVRRALGVGHLRLDRWHVDGLTVDEAETMCGILKRHPSEVWADWYTHVGAHLEADLDRLRQPCAAGGCETAFIPGSWNGRFCSARCKAREEWRRRAPTMTADKVEAKRAYARSYRARAQAAKVARRRHVCRSLDCQAVFTPLRGDQGYCTPRCRRREKTRRHRAARRAA